VFCAGFIPSDGSGRGRRRRRWRWRWWRWRWWRGSRWWRSRCGRRSRSRCITGSRRFKHEQGHAQQEHAQNYENEKATFNNVSTKAPDLIGHGAFSRHGVHPPAPDDLRSDADADRPATTGIGKNEGSIVRDADPTSSAPYDMATPLQLTGGSDDPHERIKRPSRQPGQAKFWRLDEVDRIAWFQYSVTQWSRYLPFSKYTPKPQRARAGMPKVRSMAT
jgi:hypothetical protein